MINSGLIQKNDLIFVEIEVVGNHLAGYSNGDAGITIEYSNIKISEKVHEANIEPFKQVLHLRFRPCGLGEVYVLY